MMYNLFTEKDSNLENAFSEASRLFNIRMFKHYDDGLFTTNYALNNYKHLEIAAKNRITHWQKILKKF